MSPSTQSHLSELKRRHQTIEREIKDAIQHPATDPVSITSLKRRKLSIKDRIGLIEGTLH